MEDINKFLGGMNQDVHPINQPDHTVRKFVNFVPLTKDGNLYSVTNEQGTVLFPNVSFPDGMQVIGSSVLNTDIIVILASNSGNSQVGIIKDDNDLHPIYGKYHPIAPYDDNTQDVPIDNNELGFSSTFPVDCVSRKLINGHRILYYTDNNNPVGRIDLDNPPLVGTVGEQSRLVFNQKLPDINIKEIRENATGSIRPGVYQFITRYVTENGGVTSFGIPCNPIPMVPTNQTVGPDDYVGAFYEDQVINKNIILNISNVDTQYRELEIVAIYYEGSQSVFKASIVGQVPIVKDSLEFTFTGPDTEAMIDLTREELRKIPISYTRAKCIEQKDNTLFLSNLSSDRQSDDELLQSIANAVRVKYKIEEVQFSGRGDSAQVSSLGFVAQTPILGPTGNDLDITFTKSVDEATPVNNFILYKPGTVASATITITDSNLIVDADLLQIGAGPSQTAVNFEAESAASGNPNTFVYVPGDDDSTAENLATAIVSSSDVTEYTALVSGNVITLYWSTVDLSSNGIVVGWSGDGGAVTVSGNFAGANATPFTETATGININNAQVNVSFPSVVSTADELQIVTVLSTEGDSYTTGDESGPFLSILDEPVSNTNSALEAGFTDYVNEQLTFDRKGYRRGEIYSLGFCLLYKDGSTSFVYHIPGYSGYIDEADFSNDVNKFNPTNGDIWPSFSQSAISNGFLGTYVSTAEYPVRQNYPGNQIGDDNTTYGSGDSTSIQGPGANTSRKVRHHLMPSIENEPHYRIDSGGITWIRILNLDFEFTKAIPQSILKDVEEIMFVRERRNTDQNRSIIAQGVVNREVVSADSYNNSGKIEGNTLNGGTVVNNPKSGYYAMEMPFFNNLESIDMTGKNENKSSGHTRAGLTYPNLTGERWTGSYADGERQDSTLFNNRVFFHSPETELLTGFTFTADTIVNAEVKPVLNMIGDYKRVNYKQLEWKSEAGDDWLNKTSYADLFGDYRNYETSLLANTSSISNARFGDNGKLRLPALDTVTEQTLKTSTRWTPGGLELLLDSNLSDAGGSKFKIIYDIDFKDKATVCISDCNGTRKRGSIEDVTYSEDFDDLNKVDRLRRYLYNIVLQNDQQYGQLSIASYIPISRRNPFESNGSFRLDYNSVFGGDTFITKFAYNGSQLIHNTGYDRKTDRSINMPNRTSDQRPTGYGHIDEIKRIETENIPHWGYDLRWTTYFFVESNINTYYRHQPAAEEKQKYFPKENNLSDLLEDYRGYLGNVRTYNTQFSYENNLKEFYIKGSTQNVVTKFENRTIYSETAAQDDTLDSYRSFLQSNYYDLPSNTGPIWDSFVEYNSLFLHTPKGLWKTFAEPAATISGGNISDAVLGTGSLFSRPSVEMLTTEGGYGGTISQYGGAHTQIGYIFPDVLQGKVFVLAISQNGPHLKELSMDGIQSFMHKNLPENLIVTNGVVDLSNIKTENAHLIDNPFKSIGINGGYDYKLRRYFMTKHNGFTLTFSVVTNNWFSFHDYSPNIIIPFDNRVLFFRNQSNNVDITTELWEMNIGPRGSYFDQIYDSTLEFVSAFKNNKSKSYQNLKIVSDSYQNGSKIRDDNFKTLQVLNDRMNTGLYNIIHGNGFYPSSQEGEVLLKYRNDEYRLAIPRDSVVNNSNDVTDPSNIYIPQGGFVPVDDAYWFRERIKGDYAEIKLSYDNVPNREFVLNHISTIFNNNIR